MKNRTYTSLIDPTCPECSEVLNFFELGIWECANYDECGYKEKNNLTICMGNKGNCGELILIKNEFDLIADQYCPGCLLKQNICIECGGTTEEVDSIVTCKQCGLVASDDNELKALNRIELIRSKKSLKKDQKKITYD